MRLATIRRLDFLSDRDFIAVIMTGESNKAAGVRQRATVYITADRRSQARQDSSLSVTFSEAWLEMASARRVRL